MNKKIIGILVCMLFIASVYPSAANIRMFSTSEMQGDEKSNVLITEDLDFDFMGYSRAGETKTATVRLKFFVREGWTKNITNIVKEINEIYKVQTGENNTQFTWNGTAVTLGNSNWTKTNKKLLQDLKNRRNCSEGINVVFCPNAYLPANTNGRTRMITCSGVRNGPSSGVIVKDTCNETRMINTLAHELLHALGLSHDQVKWRDPDTGNITSKNLTTRRRIGVKIKTLRAAWLGFSVPPHGYAYWDRDADCWVNDSNDPALDEVWPNRGFDINGNCTFNDSEDRNNLLYGFSRWRDPNPTITEAQREYIYSNAMQTPGTRSTTVGETSEREQKTINSDACSDVAGDVEQGRIDLTGSVGLLSFVYGDWIDEVLVLSMGAQEPIFSDGYEGDTFDFSYAFYLDTDDDLDTGDPNAPLPGADYNVSLLKTLEGSFATLCHYIDDEGVWLCEDDFNWSVTYGDIVNVSQGEEEADIEDGEDNVITIEIPTEIIEMNLVGYMNIMAKSEEVVMCGDVNNDSYINLIDVVYLADYVSGGGDPPIPYVCVGDVNGDGVVDTSDVLYLTDYVMGSGPPPVSDCCSDECLPMRVSKQRGYMPVINLDPFEGPPKTPVVVSGIDFSPYAEVTIMFDWEIVATAFTNSDGSFDVDIFVPLDVAEDEYYMVWAADQYGKYHQRLFYVEAQEIPEPFFVTPLPWGTPLGPNATSMLYVHGDATLWVGDPSGLEIMYTNFLYRPQDATDWIDLAVDFDGSERTVGGLEEPASDWGDGWSCQWDVSTMAEGFYDVRAEMWTSEGVMGYTEIPVYVEPTPPIPTFIQPAYDDVVQGDITLQVSTTDENPTYVVYDLLDAAPYYEKGVELKNQLHYLWNKSGKNLSRVCCGPTAAASCLKYWAEHGYPRIMKKNGTGDPINQSQLVERLAELMRTDENGTTDSNFVRGIRDFLNEVGVGCNNRSGLVTRVESNGYNDGVAGNNCTFERYKNELEAKREDVLWGIVFNWNATSNKWEGGHWMTGNSVNNTPKNDTDGDGLNEHDVDFMDPWGGRTLNVSMNTDGTYRHNGRWYYPDIIVTVSEKNETNPQAPPTTTLGIAEAPIFTFTWDTTTVDNGYYFIRATMVDDDGWKGQDMIVVKVENEAEVICGDCNDDGIINLGDVVKLINYLYRGGEPPIPYTCVGDVTCDGIVNLGDVVKLINYLYRGGEPPCQECCDFPRGDLVSYNGCKEFQKGPIDETPPDQDCMEYQYDGENVLLLKHVNAGFNCCPEIAANITIENNVITIEEIEIFWDCYCLCLFDLNYEISYLQPGVYTIRVIEPYVPEGDELLEFIVDLTSPTSGSYCVQRDYYPWGVIQ